MSMRLLAIALVVSLPTTASALMFDADGAGGLDAVAIGGFDWNNSSFLAKGGNTAIANWLGTGGTLGTGADPYKFDVYTHAAVSSILGTEGAAISTTGLNSSFELTMIAGFGEFVSFASAPLGLATFATTAGGVLSTGAAPFLEIYASSVNSNAVSGSGFGDGVLLLRASLVENASTGLFQATSAPGTAVLLDSNGADNWFGRASITGVGSQSPLVLGGVDFINTDYFKVSPGESLNLTFSNFSISLPFTSTNPSDCFNLSGALCSADGIASPRLEADGPLIPNFGFGGINGASGPDFIAQTDFNNTFTVTGAPVPVPAAAWLFASALAGVAGIARRRS